MPNVGDIFGIVIYIIKEVGQRHHLPHFKAVYGSHTANYDINSGMRLAGNMPYKQDKRIRQLIQRHKQELLNEWNNQQQENPKPAKKINFEIK